MKKNKYKLVLTIISLGLVVNLIIGGSVYSREAAEQENAEALRRIGTMMRVMMLIRQDYIDADQTDYKTLIYNALEGMVSRLDPHSSFLQPQAYRDMLETTEGKFGGIGIIVTMRDETLTIVSPIESTPGSKAGLRAGDQIVSINGASTEKMEMEQAVTIIKGEPGTEVELEVYRPDTEETLIFKIVRDIIEVSSVTHAKMVDDSIAYLRITQFNEATSDLLGEKLQELTEEGMEALIIDLRNNPGGLLSAAVHVSSHFLEPGDLVVYTEGRRPSQQQKHRTMRVSKRFDIPLAILINQASASASEIVAGGLRDNNRALLVGEKTFGKGSVQSLIGLPDGSALRLTTAVYQTPSRRVIHEKGIEPDIEVIISREQMRKLLEAYQKAAEKDEFIEIDTDPQLSRAVEVLRNYDLFKSGRSSSP